MEYELTVYSCLPEEEALLRSQAAKKRVELRLTREPLTLQNAHWARGTVSVSHRDSVDATVLKVLSREGVCALCTRSVGTDHIDLKAAKALGIPTFNTPYSPEGVADYTLFLLLAALRGAPRIFRQAREGNFSLPGERAKELHEMCIGVVGAGRIGRAVIRRLEGFGCKVRIADPGADAGEHPVSLETLLETCDGLTLHLPLTPGTRHLLGEKEFQMMRREPSWSIPRAGDWWILRRFCARWIAAGADLRRWTWWKRRKGCSDTRFAGRRFVRRWPRWRAIRECC